METLKLLLIAILLANGMAEESREGRGCHDGQGKLKKRPYIRRRHHLKETFGNRHKLKPEILPEEDNNPPSLQELDYTTLSSNWPASNPQPREVETISQRPRLIISENGDVSFGRSLKFQYLKSFHDEDEFASLYPDEYHINEEDHTHSHKSLRTARHARAAPGKPEHLTSTLAGIQQSGEQTLQVIGLGQGAHGWTAGEISGTGGQIIYGSTGESGAVIEGTMVASGLTSNTASGSSGWKSPNSGTYQGVTGGNSAGASEYLNTQASGNHVSVSNSEASESSGSGTFTTSGTTSVVTTGGGSNGWRAAPGRGSGSFLGTGANNVANAGDYLSTTATGNAVTVENSGASNVQGSGSTSTWGTSSVITSDRPNNGWKRP